MSETHNMELDDHITKKYDIKKRLGKGAYGIVWKAVDSKTKEIVALKKIFDAFQNQVDAQRTYREIMFLKAFGAHPNIIKLQGIHKASNNKDIYLVFDYMDTDLHKVIQNKNILKDIHKRYIMYQLLLATMYMHSGNVIHRDQKPSNILLDTTCKCKIADFGLARSLNQLSEIPDGVGDPPLTDYVATRWYRAPEILVGSTRYTKGIDMWSLGCILAEMLLERPLFPGGSSLKQLELIMRTLPKPAPEDLRLLINTYGGCKLFAHQSSKNQSQSLSEILNGAPPDAIDLVEQLLVLNPQKRLTAVEALKHPYVAKFHSMEKEEPFLKKSVTPPLSDNTMLSVEEYRNKLYELASMSPHSHSAPPSRRNSQKLLAPSTNPATAGPSSATAAKRSQARQSRHASLEEKSKSNKSKSNLAPPADWPDRRASLPKRLPQTQGDANACGVNKPSTIKAHQVAPAERKASLPVLPQANSRSPQHVPAPGPDRAKLTTHKPPSNFDNNRGSRRRQFSNKANVSTWSDPSNLKVCFLKNNSATVNFPLHKILPHLGY